MFYLSIYLLFLKTLRRPSEKPSPPSFESRPWGWEPLVYPLLPLPALPPSFSPSLSPSLSLTLFRSSFYQMSRWILVHRDAGELKKTSNFGVFDWKFIEYCHCRGNRFVIATEDWCLNDGVLIIIFWVMEENKVQLTHTRYNRKIRIVNILYYIVVVRII